MQPAADQYRNDIQGLRAIAVGLVVLYHAGLPLPGGFVGVDVFFVISGYVITLLLLREQQTHGRVDLGRFYLRRALRLLPALTLTIAVTVLLAAVILSPLGPQQTAVETGLAALLLSANQRIAALSGDYFAAAAEINPLLHLWSLSVEEQFYLLYPLLLAGVLHSAGRRPLLQRLLPISAVTLLLAASFAWMRFAPQQLTDGPWLWLAGYYSPLTRAWEFAAGALAALRGRASTAPRFALAASVIGLPGLAAASVLISSSTPFPGLWTLLPVAATVLLLLGGRSDHPLSRLLGSRLLRRLGDLSYGWYLWHWPLIVFASILWPDQPLVPPAAAAVALAVAAVSYRHLEQPLRRRADLPPRRALRPLLLLLAPAVGSALLTYQVAEQFWRPRLPDPVYAREGNAPVRLPDNLNDCFGDQAPDPPQMCQWQPAAAGTPIYLIGDSNAGMLREGLILASKELDRPFGLSNTAGCAFLPHRAEFDRLPRSARCRAAYARTQQHLRDAAPGLVLMAMSERLYALDPTTADGQRKAAQLEQSLTASLTWLRSAGHQVLIVQPLPNFFGRYQWDPARCTLMQLVADDCRGSLPVAAAHADTAALRALLARTAAANGAAVIDIVDAICPDGVCLTRRGDAFIFADAGHITFEASVGLADDWQALLRTR
jgi:peptidoglycan/LPS O-acetylase OafA/YrhL